MNKATINFGTRLRIERQKNGWTQVEMSEKLSEMGYPVSEKSISAYETNRRKPTFDCLQLLCELLGVTRDYLSGNDIAHTTLPKPSTKQPLVTRKGYYLRCSEYSFYDGMPVYVEFSYAYAKAPEWGILDYDNYCVVTKNDIIRITKETLLYCYVNPDIRVKNKRPCSYSEIVKTRNRIFVELKMGNTFDRTYNNGWYIYDSVEKRLRHTVTGLTLEPALVGIVFDAYSE